MVLQISFDKLEGLWQSKQIHFSYFLALRSHFHIKTYNLQNIHLIPLNYSVFVCSTWTSSEQNISFHALLDTNSQMNFKYQELILEINVWHLFYRKKVVKKKKKQPHPVLHEASSPFRLDLRNSFVELSKIPFWYFLKIGRGRRWKIWRGIIKLFTNCWRF